MNIEDGLKVEVDKLKNMLGICVTVIMVLVVVIVRGWTA